MVLVRLLFMMLSMRTHEIQQKDYDCVDELDALGGWFSSVTTFRGMRMPSDLFSLRSTPDDGYNRLTAVSKRKPPKK